MKKGVGLCYCHLRHKYTLDIASFGILSTCCSAWARVSSCGDIRKEVVPMKVLKDAKRPWVSLGLPHWLARATLLVLALCIRQVACAATPTLFGVVKNDRLASTEEIQSIQIIRNHVRIVPGLNMPLEIGDDITTDPESTVVIRYPNGSEVYLRPSTHVEIQSINLLYGELFAKVKGTFRVETSFATAGVEGTEFLLRVDPDDQLSVIVMDGVVNLTPKTRGLYSISVEKDQKAVISGEIIGVPKLRGREVPGPMMSPRMKQVPQKKRASEEELNTIKQWTSRVEQLIKKAKP